MQRHHFLPPSVPWYRVSSSCGHGFVSNICSPELVSKSYSLREVSGRNHLLAGFLSFCVTAQLVSTVLFIHKLRGIEHLREILDIIAYERAMNVIVLFTDSAIAVSLILLLRRHRCGSKRGDGVIRRLVMFTIGTGLITGVMAILAFITAEALPQTFIYLIIDFCMAKRKSMIATDIPRI